MLNRDDRLAQDAVRDEWRGAWIWPEDTEKARNAYALFRRRFRAVQDGVLRIDIAADNVYGLTVDGRFIGRGPARSHLEYFSYDSFEIPLTRGEHIIAVTAHHVGQENACMMLGRPGLIADVTFVSDTSEQVDLSTGEGWKCILSDAWEKNPPELMSHFGFYELRDLRMLPRRWRTQEFDDSGWSQPFVIGRPPCAPWTRMIKRDLPLLQMEERNCVPVAVGKWLEVQPDAPLPADQSHSRTRTRASSMPEIPIELGVSDAGRHVTVDFGRTTSGYLTLGFLNSTPGQVVDVSYDEVLKPDGAVDPERTYARMTDRYILDGGPTEIIVAHPRGFRYVTIDAHPTPEQMVLGSVTAIEETYPFEMQESFSSSDDQLERFFAKSGLTVRISTADAYMDCPTRERVQWMEDMYMHNRVAAFAFGDMTMSRHALFQAAQGQLADGRINGFFPTDRTNLGFASSSLMWINMLVDYWLHTGNDDIQSLLPPTKRLLDFIDSCKDEFGLISSWPAGQFWDWAPLDDTGCLLLTNAAYIIALERLNAHEVFRSALGDLSAKIEQARRSDHERFWSPERGIYIDKIEPDGTHGPLASQHANVMAVIAGICPKDTRQELLRRIIDPANLGPVPVGENAETPDDLRASGKIIPVGTLWFGHFVCQALYESGMEQEALDQMRMLWGAHDDQPLMPETRIPHGNIGYCHGWACGPSFLLPAYVLGVQPIDKGWSEITFTPNPANLEYACGVFKTPHGPLAAYWALDGNSYKLSLDLPKGVRARVSFRGIDEIVNGGHWEAMAGN